MINRPLIHSLSPGFVASSLCQVFLKKIVELAYYVEGEDCGHDLIYCPKSALFVRQIYNYIDLSTFIIILFYKL